MYIAPSPLLSVRLHAPLYCRNCMIRSSFMSPMVLCSWLNTWFVFNKYMLKWIELMFRDFQPRKQKCTMKASLWRGKISNNSPSRLYLMFPWPCNAFNSPYPLLFLFILWTLLPTIDFSLNEIITLISILFLVNASIILVHKAKICVSETFPGVAEAKSILLVICWG